MLGEGGVQGQPPLIGPGGPGEIAGGAEGQTPDVTGHVRAEFLRGGHIVCEDRGDVVDFFP